MWKKNGVSAFYHTGPIFDVKKFLHKLLPSKKIMHNLRQEKIHGPENCPAHPKNNNGPSLMSVVKCVK